MLGRDVGTPYFFHKSQEYSICVPVLDREPHISTVAVSFRGIRRGYGGVQHGAECMLQEHTLGSCPGEGQKGCRVLEYY